MPNAGLNICKQPQEITKNSVQTAAKINIMKQHVFLGLLMMFLLSGSSGSSS
jgi:hypothetical protein